MLRVHLEEKVRSRIQEMGTYTQIVCEATVNRVYGGDQRLLPWNATIVHKAAAQKFQVSIRYQTIYTVLTALGPSEILSDFQLYNPVQRIQRIERQDVRADST